MARKSIFDNLEDSLSDSTDYLLDPGFNGKDKKAAKEAVIKSASEVSIDSLVGFKDHPYRVDEESEDYIYQHQQNEEYCRRHTGYCGGQSFQDRAGNVSVVQEDCDRSGDAQDQGYANQIGSAVYELTNDVLLADAADDTDGNA